MYLFICFIKINYHHQPSVWVHEHVWCIAPYTSLPVTETIPGTGLLPLKFSPVSSTSHGSWKGSCGKNISMALTRPRKACLYRPCWQDALLRRTWSRVTCCSFEDAASWMKPCWPASRCLRWRLVWRPGFAGFRLQLLTAAYLFLSAHIHRCTQSGWGSIDLPVLAIHHGSYRYYMKWNEPKITKSHWGISWVSSGYVWTTWTSARQHVSVWRVTRSFRTEEPVLV